MARAPESMMHRLIGALVVLSASGCGGWNQRALPTPESPLPKQGTGSLRAGFGRADITPAPGVALGGNGPEGLVSTGYRHRLYARALVLEDPAGERIALVTLDQAHVSANLHRLAAERLVEPTGIGADRLIISATHSHSGGAHFYGERQFNDIAARLAGYDPAMVDLIVNGIVGAVRQAFGQLRPARAAWGFQRVQGYTKNRSYALAYCRNPPALRLPCAPEPGGESPDSLLRSVDTEWKLLRVDVETSPGLYRPAGAYSVFAIHGTANPSTTTLLDGDIHAVVERRLEALIDAMNGELPGYANHAVHVFANGTEGDVSPNRPPETQCPVPTLRSPPFDGPRAPPSPWIWADADSAVLARCLAAARRFIDAAGRALGDSAFANFQRLAGSLTSQFPIRRAFTTLPLPGRDGLCDTPLVGTSTAAGASDVPTRVAGWRFLGVFPSEFEQGGHAIRKPPRGCQAEKKPLLGGLQTALIVGKHGLPDVAQLSLVRMGDVFLATVPMEPTTTTGRLIGTALAEAVRPAVSSPHVIVVSLTNGFVEYVADKYEYAGQTYEGGSTLYGPHTVEFLTGNLAELGRALIGAEGHSPPAPVGPITAYPGKPSEILPRKSARPALTGSRVLLSRACLPGGELRLTWLDEPPGRLAPWEGQVLAIDQGRDADWVPVAWDDQDDVVVRAVRRVRGRGFEWSVTLSRAGLTGGALRLRLLPGHGQPEYVSEPFPGCDRPQ